MVERNGNSAGFVVDTTAKVTGKVLTEADQNAINQENGAADRPELNRGDERLKLERSRHEAQQRSHPDRPATPAYHLCGRQTG